MCGERRDSEIKLAQRVLSRSTGTCVFVPIMLKIEPFALKKDLVPFLLYNEKHGTQIRADVFYVQGGRE